MGTHPIFESDFDCLTEFRRFVMRLSALLLFTGTDAILPFLAAGAAYFGAPAALSAAGFTGAGIAAGSVAAGIQSAVYGAATAGAFSAAQSAGMAGMAVGTKAALAAAAGGAAYASQDNDRK